MLLYNRSYVLLLLYRLRENVYLKQHCLPNWRNIKVKKRKLVLYDISEVGIDVIFLYGLLSSEDHPTSCHLHPCFGVKLSETEDDLAEQVWF